MEDIYVLGPVRWLTDNPGRQMIGSFHPHEADDCEKGAYLKAGARKEEKKTPEVKKAVVLVVDQ